jgi:hypothetical protein
MQQRRLQTLPGQYRPIEADPEFLKAQRRRQAADALLNVGYTPGSGGLGALAQVLSSLAGTKLAQSADESVSKSVASYFDRQQQDEARQLEEMSRREQAELQAKITRAMKLPQIAGDPVKAEMYARGEVKLKDLEGPEEDWRFSGGLWVNPRTREVQETPYYNRPNAGGGGGGGGAAMPETMPDGSPIRDKFDRAVLNGILTPEQAQQSRMVEFNLAPRPTAETQGRDDRKANASRNIVNSVDFLSQQIESGEITPGPIAGPLNILSPSIQTMQGEVANIVAALRQLERVPGSGADTDKELQFILDQAPGVMTNPSAALHRLQRLREKALEYAPYLDGISGEDAFGSFAPAPAGAAPANWRAVYGF